VIKVVAALLVAGGAMIAMSSASLPTEGATPDACSEMSFDASRFTICRFDPKRHDLQGFVTDQNGNPFRRFDHLRRYLGVKSKRVAFAMNAGMFDDAGFPIGLYVEDGIERHPSNDRDAPGNFYLKPNGVFWVDARGVHVAETKAYLDGARFGLRFATQSGPMLVIAGQIHPKFDFDGSSKHIRNGVGVDRAGRAVFVISSGPVSLGKFARVFRDQLGCDNALFLDGAVSSLWNGATDRIDERADIGPMIVVSERVP
jgi:uncharacterized protein YigE (DUF2233 family)